MAVEVGPLTLTAEWLYEDENLKKLQRDIDETQRKTAESTRMMGRDYLRLGTAIASVTTAGMSLESTWERVAKGQMSVIAGILRSIPAIASLAASIWTIVTAEKARAIAHAIAQALSGPPGWAILAGAAAMAGIGIGMAASIPSRQAGGPIYRTGLYKLEAGEVYRRGSSPSINITISGNTISPETLPEISRKLIDDMTASGVI